MGPPPASLPAEGEEESRFASSADEEELGSSEERLEDLRGSERARPIDLSTAIGDVIRLLSATGDLDGALELSERRLLMIQQLEPVASAQVLAEHSYQLELTPDLGRALEIEEKAMLLLQRVDDDLGLSHSSARSARLCEKLERLEEARQHLQRRLELAATVGKDRDHLNALLDYGRFLGGQEDIESALSYLEEARSLARKAEPLDRAVVLAELAYWLEQIDRLEEAEGLLGERIALLSGAGLMAESISARGDLARFFAGHERVEEALALSRERLELAQSLSGEGDEQRLAWIASLAGHGQLLEDAGETREATEYYEERWRLISLVDDLGVRAYAAADLARVCHRLGDTERALGVLEDLWPSLVEQAKAQPQVLAVVGEHLAELRIEVGNRKGAVGAIEQTEAAYEAVRDTAGLERLRKLRD